ncbi:Hypothetical predicted protein [Cloeon dipterum]|uniref:Uncharacterized protein n=1 Tax=Cloeon dipterum TaxID=197152 RepID=A0A8S1DPQ1_9INSE|nr:Hypothetical predicted protein [Cloeon dipterum]
MSQCMENKPENACGLGGRFDPKMSFEQKQSKKHQQGKISALAERGSKPVDFWCSCGLHCEDTGSPVENLCCKDTEYVEELCKESEIECVTLHPGFEPVVTNKYVLNMYFGNWETGHNLMADGREFHCCTMRNENECTSRSVRARGGISRCSPPLCMNENSNSYERAQQSKSGLERLGIQPLPTSEEENTPRRIIANKRYASGDSLAGSSSKKTKSRSTLVSAEKQPSAVSERQLPMSLEVTHSNINSADESLPTVAVLSVDLLGLSTSVNSEAAATGQHAEDFWPETTREDHAEGNSDFEGENSELNTASRAEVSSNDSTKIERALAEILGRNNASHKELLDKLGNIERKICLLHQVCAKNGPNLAHQPLNDEFALPLEDKDGPARKMMSVT